MHQHVNLDMGNLLVAQERERFLARLLLKHGITSLESLRVFEAGCAGGYTLRLMVQWGARPEHLSGVEIDASAAAQCARYSPEIHVHVGSADDLDEPDQVFDISLAFGLFSRVLDEDLAHGIARELFRITKPGGLIVIYDLQRKDTRNRRTHAVEEDDIRYDLQRKDTRNRRTHAVEEDDIRRWFPKCPLRVRSITVDPLIAGLAGRYAPWLYGTLAAIPQLRTHAVYVLRRPATSPFP